MDKKDQRYIYEIDFRTCDYDDAHHIYHTTDELMTYAEALGYIRHWALDLIDNLKINGESTGWDEFKHLQYDLQRKEENS